MMLGLSTTAVFVIDSTVIMLYITAVYGLEHFIADAVTYKVGCVKPDGKHLVERIGIFMILLFGESFITLVGYYVNLKYKFI